MNVYLPIETKSRELESKMLLALEAVARGHEVLIGPLSIVFSWGPVGLLKPGIFHDKSLTPSKSKINAYKKIKQNGGKITSLDEEGGFLTEKFDLFGKLRYANDTLDLADRVFFWGKFDHNWVSNVFVQHSSKFVITGSPRVDLWNFDREIKLKKTKQLDDYILIVSNFGFVLNQNRFWNMIDNYRANNYLNSEFDIESLTDKYSYQVKLFGEFVKLIQELSINYPDKEIIIRPHPIENKNAWKPFVVDLSNVKVVYEGSIDKWITNASVIIHNSCTSAFEASVKKTPIIAFSPYESKHEKSTSNSIGEKVSDIRGVLDLVHQVFNATEESSMGKSDFKEDFVESRLYNASAIGAFASIVDAWEQLDAGLLDQKNNWNLISSRLYLSTWKKKFLTKSVKPKEGSSFSVGHKFMDLEKSEIEKLISDLSPLIKYLPKVRIKKVFKKTYVLSAEE